MYAGFDLNGRVVVITGGTGILGSLFCRRFAEASAQVVISDLSQENCYRLAEEISRDTGSVCKGISVDLSNEKSVKAWAKKVFENMESVDVLVNSAATKSQKFFSPLEQYSLEDWNEVVAVNISGIFLAVREIGPRMVEQGKGSIINISSIYGIVGPDQRIYEGSWYEELGGKINTPLVYSATKAAVIGMTKHLSTYWGSKGVRINAISPGGVSSGQNKTFIDKYSDRVPLGRMAEAEELVGALLFLASDASSYVNGHNIIIDGGLTAW